MDPCAARGQNEGVPTSSPPSPFEVVRIERGRAALQVSARGAGVSLEATFSGGPDGVSLRVIRGGQARVLSRDAIARHPALSAVLRLVADEVDISRPPSEVLVASLLQSALIYVRRIDTPVPLPRWGRPLRDRRVERAIERLNEDIARRWTVERLAREVGLSRPVFAREFQRALGLSPMRYLTQRRMLAAAALLFGSDAALAEVARRVGYESEFAFSRAFKRHFSVPPGVYRQQQPQQQPAVVACALRAAA